ncbi:hypothetical protein [Brevibacillus laterosporus]|uniref:hypothetical protein n=1 Tax=Brevibacillus laterosporus TaxID=1465 RepID=UPI000E6C2BF5|nr:hypothetical protein [Brevibacillus laterosporus]AYB38320.1 hypothetical protein D5F52_08645 [Brevibacillus laterosporus]MBM7110335.1 hypothetical protein [Brevibacillus laterosporus]
MLNGKKSYLLSFTALFSKKGYKLAFGINQIFDKNNKYHLTAPVNSTYRALKEDTMKSADKIPYLATGLLGRMPTLAEYATEYEVTEMETVTAEIVTYLADIHQHLSGINKAIYDVDIETCIRSKSANDGAESDVADMEEASPSTPKLEVFRITFSDHSICNVRIHDAGNIFAEPFTSRSELDVERFSNPIMKQISTDTISLEIGSDNNVLETDLKNNILADPISQVSGLNTNKFSKSTRTNEIKNGLIHNFIVTNIINKEISIDGVGKDKARITNLETAATDVITTTTEDRILYSTQVQETTDARRKVEEYLVDVSLADRGHNLTRDTIKDVNRDDFLTANSPILTDGDVVHSTRMNTKRYDYVGHTHSLLNAGQAVDEHEFVDRLVEFESHREFEVDKLGIKAVKDYTATDATVHQEEKGECYQESVGVNMLETASHSKGTFQAVEDHVTFSNQNNMYNAFTLGDASEVRDHLLDGIVDKDLNAFRDHPNEIIYHQVAQAKSQKIEDTTRLGHSVADSESSYELIVDVKEQASHSTDREVTISRGRVAESSKNEYAEINRSESGRKCKYMDAKEGRSASSVLGTHNDLALIDGNKFAFYRVGPNTAVNVGMSEGSSDNVSNGSIHIIESANMLADLKESSDDTNKLSEAVLSITADGEDEARFSEAELIREQIIRHPDIIQTARIMTIMYGARAAEIIEAGMDKIISNGFIDKTVKTDSLESITQATVDKLKAVTTGSNMQGILDYIEQANSDKSVNANHEESVRADSVCRADFTGEAEEGTEARQQQSNMETDSDSLHVGKHNGLGEGMSAEELSRAISEANTRLGIVSECNAATREHSAEGYELKAIEFADVNLTENGVTLETESSYLDNNTIDTQSSNVDRGVLRHGNDESILHVIESGIQGNYAEAVTDSLQIGKPNRLGEGMSSEELSKAICEANTRLGIVSECNAATREHSAEGFEPIEFADINLLPHIDETEVHTITGSTYSRTYDTVIETRDTAYSDNDRVATLFKHEVASNELNENATVNEINYADTVSNEDETVMETTSSADSIYSTEPTISDEVSESIRKKRIFYTDMQNDTDGTRVKKTIETRTSGQGDATRVRERVEATPNDDGGAARMIRTVNVEIEEGLESERKRRTIDVNTELGSTATNETIPVAPKRKIWIILGKLATWSNWNWKKTR